MLDMLNYSSISFKSLVKYIKYKTDKTAPRNPNKVIDENTITKTECIPDKKLDAIYIRTIGRIKAQNRYQRILKVFLIVIFLLNFFAVVMPLIMKDTRVISEQTRYSMVSILLLIIQFIIPFTFIFIKSIDYRIFYKYRKMVNKKFLNRDTCEKI